MRYWASFFKLYCLRRLEEEESLIYGPPFFKIPTLFTCSIAVRICPRKNLSSCDTWIGGKVWAQRPLDWLFPSLVMRVSRVTSILTFFTHWAAIPGCHYSYSQAISFPHPGLLICPEPPTGDLFPCSDDWCINSSFDVLLMMKTFSKPSCTRR